MYKQSNLCNCNFLWCGWDCLYNNPKTNNTKKKGSCNCNYPRDRSDFNPHASFFDYTPDGGGVKVPLRLATSDASPIINVCAVRLCTCTGHVRFGEPLPVDYKDEPDIWVVRIGHEKPSMPRVRGDSLVVTLILRHDQPFFLNNLLNYFFFA